MHRQNPTTKRKKQGPSHHRWHLVPKLRLNVLKLIKQRDDDGFRCDEKDPVNFPSSNGYSLLDSVAVFAYTATKISNLGE
jgi:hypothetical protein